MSETSVIFSLDVIERFGPIVYAINWTENENFYFPLTSINIRAN